jgi:hypothetical protein
MMHRHQEHDSIPYKKILIPAAILVVLFAVGAMSLAWFNYQRGLQALTAVNDPIHLYIRAGHGDDVARLYLGDIDVENSLGSADYVFSVESEEAADYTLQLAHTTNIGFQYEIYRAVESTESTENAVAYEGADGVTYYYTYTESAKVSGAYLNRTNSTGLADQTYHEVTYQDYDNVQKNAEPLYWQGVVTPARAADGSSQLDYFILHITWEAGTIQNDKETDIVYLTAGRSGDENTQ